LVLPASHGDAAIYFNYFKRFFPLPFTYQPDTVAYGATSPLHTLLFAIVYRVSGDFWYLGAKILNLALVGIGLVEIARAQRQAHTLLTVTALALAFRTVWLAAAQLFEVGVTFLAVAVFTVRYDRSSRLALIIAGLLPAVRPELALISAAVGLDCVVRRRFRDLPWVAAGAVIPLAYTLWMAAHGAGWIPSSAASRVLRAYEGEPTWWQRWGVTADYVRSVDPAYLFALPATALALLWRRQPRGALLVLIPLVGVFAAVPPRYFAPRYFVPLIPVVLAVLTAELWRDSERRPRSAALVLVASFLFAFWQLTGHWERREEYARYDLSRWLLDDLTAQLNPRLAADEAVLIYEIQAQYGLLGRALSADGTVGAEARAMLLRRESVADFLRRNKVRYVVTSNAFNYRKIYSDTLFAALYLHDLENPIGATFSRDGVRLRKALSNPSFAEPSGHILTPFADLNHGTAIRMYADRNWRGYSLLWNSVYEVLDTATG
jgi:hypothetical protein